MPQVMVYVSDASHYYVSEKAKALGVTTAKYISLLCDEARRVEEENE